MSDRKIWTLKDLDDLRRRIKSGLDVRNLMGDVICWCNLSNSEVPKAPLEVQPMSNPKLFLSTAVISGIFGGLGQLDTRLVLNPGQC